MSQGGTLKTDILGSRRAKTYSMIEKKSAVDPGFWIEDPAIDGGSLEFSKEGAGALTFTAKLFGSNSPTMPADDGFQIGADISALGLTAVTMKCRWYKVKVTAITADANTFLHSRMHVQTFKP